MPKQDERWEWGWFYPDAAPVAQSLHAELQGELPPGHLLFGRAVETVAFRKDQDDVLYRHPPDLDSKAGVGCQTSVRVFRRHFLGVRYQRAEGL
jgi:hypothetical protein